MIESSRHRRHHAVIAGTGRTGTSFLVRWLSACGIEAQPETAGFSPRARAGFERTLDADRDLPYLVKDPWLFDYCETVDLQALVIDALIVPVRDLTNAAESRVLQERMALLERGLDARAAPAMVAASTPGGILYSLEVVDQARVLAVGFHDLVHWALRNELPLFFLDFPRLVRDPEHTVGTLWPWLRAHCAREHALACFTDVAEPDAVRLGRPADAAAALASERESLARTAALEYVEELRVANERLSAEAARLRDRAQRSDALAAEVESGRRHALALESARAEAGRQVAALGDEVTRARERLALIEATPIWRWLAPVRAARHAWRDRSRA